MNRKYYTIKEAAEILEITEATTRNYISLGRLKSEKIYNSAVISEEEVNRYKESMKREVL